MAIENGTQGELFPQDDLPVKPRKKDTRDRSAYKRQQKEARLAAGLCILCGKAPHLESAQWCQACKERRISIQQKSYRKGRVKRGLPAIPESRLNPVSADMRAYRRQWRQHKREQGLCTNCGVRPATENSVRCQPCIDRDRVASKGRYHRNAKKYGAVAKAKRDQWIAEGKCSWCGGEREDPERKRCRACHKYGLERLRARARRHREQGLCPSCGKLPERGITCSVCRKNARDYYDRDMQRKREKGFVPPERLVCVKCRREKPVTDFHRNFKNPSGFAFRCRECKRQWYQENRDRLRTKAKAHRLTAGNRLRAQQRSAYKRKTDAYARGERLHRRDKERAYYRAYRDLFRDVLRIRNREAMRRWRAANPDQAKAIDQAARFRRQQRLIENGGNFTGSQWRALKHAQNYTCLACGRREPEISLTVDHVIPVSKGGSNCISNLQGLCLECNLKKHTKDTDYRPSAIPTD